MLEDVEYCYSQLVAFSFMQQLSLKAAHREWVSNATNEGEITKLIGELINSNEELARIYLPKIMALIPDNEAKQIIDLKTTW
jgi:hypothetical protein